MEVKIIIDVPDKLKDVNKGLFIYFNYSSRIVQIMRSFEKRFYHPDTKNWELDFAMLESLKSKLDEQAVLYEVIDESPLVTYSDDSLTKCQSCDVVHTFKTPPLGHQQEGFNYGMNSDKWLLADDPG